MKPHSTLRTLLVHPKDKTGPKKGVYTIDCAGCSKKYVGETKRKLKASERTYRTETEKVGSNIHKRQKETISNRDVGISHHRSYYERKSRN